MAILGRVRLIARTITKFLKNFETLFFKELFTADISDKLKSRYMKEHCQTKKGARGRRLNYSEKEIRLWQRRKHEASK
jgi:hypothetical protein